MADLLARIRAAIDATERLARLCPPWPWRANAEGDEVLAADGITVAEGFALSGNQLRHTVEHIAANDPATVLRHCAADRAIVDLHGYEEIRWPEGGGFRFCKTCGSGEPHEYPTEWPCPTLRALADAYGMEVEG